MKFESELHFEDEPDEAGPPESEPVSFHFDEEPKSRRHAGERILTGRSMSQYPNIGWGSWGDWDSSWERPSLSGVVTYEGVPTVAMERPKERDYYARKGTYLQYSPPSNQQRWRMHSKEFRRADEALGAFRHETGCHYKVLNDLAQMLRVPHAKEFDEIYARKQLSTHPENFVKKRHDDREAMWPEPFHMVYSGILQPKDYEKYLDEQHRKLPVNEWRKPVIAVRQRSLRM